MLLPILLDQVSLHIRVEGLRVQQQAVHVCTMITAFQLGICAEDSLQEAQRGLQDCLQKWSAAPHQIYSALLSAGQQKHVSGEEIIAV